MAAVLNRFSQLIEVWTSLDGMGAYSIGFDQIFSSNWKSGNYRPSIDSFPCEYVLQFHGVVVIWWKCIRFFFFFLLKYHKLIRL